MAKTEMIRARVEPELKSQAEEVFSGLGLERLLSNQPLDPRHRKHRLTGDWSPLLGMSHRTGLAVGLGPGGRCSHPGSDWNPYRFVRLIWRALQRLGPGVPPLPDNVQTPLNTLAIVLLALPVLSARRVRDIPTGVHTFACTDRPHEDA